MSPAIGLGVVGTGIFATDSHLPALQAIDNIKPVAATNRTRSKAEAYAEKAGIAKEHVYDNIDELLADPNVEAVSIQVPTDQNLVNIKKAVAAGKAVAFEKPLAPNLKEAREVVHVTSQSKKPVIILENWVYHNATKKLQELLPKIGRPVSFNYQTTGPFATSKYQATTWRLKPTHVGGYLSDGGVHDLAFLTEVLGTVESVSAHSTQLQEVSGTDDTLYSLLNLNSGVFGTFTYAKAFGATRKAIVFEIFGTEGSLHLDIEVGKPKSLTVTLGKPNTEATNEHIVIPDDEINGVVPEFRNFAEAVQANDSSLIKATPAKGFHHFAIIVAAIESSEKKGEKVVVEKL